VAIPRNHPHRDFGFIPTNQARPCNHFWGINIP
jgi:hypothetical protein